jgi:UDP-N-acetylglucosamine 2-epimerase (non-hydrolysing)
MEKKKVVTILGTRPEIIKLSPVLSKFDREFNHIIIHTGQHYDHNMDSIFFDELRLRQPDYNFNIGSGSHAHQTAIAMIKLEQVLKDVKPDLVVTFADPNAPLVGSIVASKMNIPLVHMEAGCRSFNKKMPEEINRIIADHCSDLHLAPDAVAVNNLAKENIIDSVKLVGSSGIEPSLRNREFAKNSDIVKLTGVSPEKYILATIHRAENTNDTNRLASLMQALNNIAEKTVVVFPMHPRTKKILKQSNIQLSEHIKVIEPVGYLDFLSLIDNSLFVMTDSGGIQEEAPALGKFCLVLRNETEWTYLTDAGKNILATVDGDKITSIATNLLENPEEIQRMRQIEIKQDINVSDNVVREIKTFFGEK